MNFTSDSESEKIQDHIGCIFIFFFYLFTYLLLETGEEGREKQRERNTNMRVTHQQVTSCTPSAGDLASQGIEPTFWFAGQCSVH